MIINVYVLSSERLGSGHSLVRPMVLRVVENFLSKSTFSLTPF
jgi:hypothetical protein